MNMIGKLVFAPIDPLNCSAARVFHPLNDVELVSIICEGKSGRLRAEDSIWENICKTGLIRISYEPVVEHSQCVVYRIRITTGHGRRSKEPIAVCVLTDAGVICALEEEP